VGAGTQAVVHQGHLCRTAPAQAHGLSCPALPHDSGLAPVETRPAAAAQNRIAFVFVWCAATTAGAGAAAASCPFPRLGFLDVPDE